MDARELNTIANFIWGIADDCLRDVYARDKYRNAILFMSIISHSAGTRKLLKDTDGGVVHGKQ